MITIPTGPESINRKARVLSDVKYRRDGVVAYSAGEVVTVKDVRPPSNPFSREMLDSPGFRRVTIQGHPAQRPASTSANNLEMLPEAPKTSGVTVTVHNAGGGGGYASSPWERAKISGDPVREAQKHSDLAAAHEAVARALDDLRKVEESYR